MPRIPQLDCRRLPDRRHYKWRAAWWSTTPAVGEGRPTQRRPSFRCGAFINVHINRYGGAVAVEPGIVARPPMLWRAKLRSGLAGVDHAEQLQHCLDGSLIAIGLGALLPTGSSLGGVCGWIEKNPDPGWGRRTAQTVRRFGGETRIGDFIWTRDTESHYRICRITGTYRFDSSPAAQAVDSYQVLPVEWAPAQLDDLVPARIPPWFDLASPRTAPRRPDQHSGVRPRASR